MKDGTRRLDDPAVVTRLVHGLYAACLALLVAELLVDRKGYFAVQDWLGFYAVFGFAAYCGIVTAAKGLRWLARRREDYYLPDHDREESQGDG